MAEINQQDDKKTVVAFIVGLLIGGLLVWAFSGPAADAPTKSTATTTTERESSKTTSEAATESTNTAEAASDADTPTATPALPKGDGSVTVGEVKAGTNVALSSANYPVSEGWIGVRSYQDGRLGSILGVVRFSESQGLVPSEIVLQTPTRAGAQYAVVMYSEDGDRQFNLATDVQIDQVFATFTAN